MAAALLVSCSSDDAVNEGGKNPQLNFTGNGAMQVALNFGHGTRAASYDEGTTAESQVKSAQFYFFNKATGVYLGTSGLLNNLGQTTSTGNVERLVDVEVPSTAVDALKDGDTEVYVVAVLNQDASFPTSWTVYDATTPNNATTLTQFNAAVTAAAASDLGFMMTNSVYAANSNIAENIVQLSDTKNAVVTSADVYQKDEKPADYEPVEMYVERVCAKVTLADNHTDAANGDKFEVKGWALNVLNNKYYPMKKLTNIFSAENVAVTNLWATVTNNNVTGWNNASDHRSFWAEDPNYNAYTADDFTKIGSTQLTNGVGGVQYCLENTFNNSNQKRNQTTQAVVLAQFTPANGTEGADVVSYNGAYYSTTNFLNTVLGEDNSVMKAEKYYKKMTDGTTYAALSTTDFTLAGTGAEIKIENGTDATVIGNVGGRSIAFAENVTSDGTDANVGEKVLYTKTGENNYTEVLADEALAELTATVGNYTVYVGGWCYYEIPIRHFDDTEVPFAPTDINGASQIGRYGIVRNHTYNLTINSISNVGKPFEGETITPDDTPDDQEDFAMEVKINVLSWAVRGQSIDL